VIRGEIKVVVTRVSNSWYICVSLKLCIELQPPSEKCHAKFFCNLATECYYLASLSGPRKTRSWGVVWEQGLY